MRWKSTTSVLPSRASGSSRHSVPEKAPNEGTILVNKGYCTKDTVTGFVILADPAFECFLFQCVAATPYNIQQNPFAYLSIMRIPSPRTDCSIKWCASFFPYPSLPPCTRQTHFTENHHPRLNGIRMREEYEAKMAGEEDAGMGTGIPGFNYSRGVSGGGFDVTVEGVAISGPLETPGEIRVAMEHDWRSADIGGGWKMCRVVCVAGLLFL